MKNNILRDLKFDETEILSSKRLKSKNNIVYRITLKNKKTGILKVDKKNEQRPWVVQKEIFIYHILKNYSIPVPKIYLVNTRTKPYYYLMEDLGKEDLSKTNDPNLIIILGEILAEIHKIQFKKQGRIFHDNIEERPFIQKIEDFKMQVNYSKKLSEELINKTANFKDSNKKFLCHNDFGPWQCIINKKKIMGIIDWEWAESSNPLYDLAKTEVLMDIFSPGKFKFLMMGYNKKGLTKEYSYVKKEYKIVELVNFLYIFRNHKSNFSKGIKNLRKILKDE